METAQVSSRNEIGRETRRKLEGGGKKRPDGMPYRGCFSRPTSLRHDGVTYTGIMVWSAPGKWCVTWRARCYYGATSLEAWTKFIKAIDPDIEEVVQ